VDTFLIAIPMTGNLTIRASTVLTSITS